MKSFLEFIDNKTPVQVEEEEQPVQTGRDERVERKLEEQLAEKDELKKLRAEKEELERKLEAFEKRTNEEQTGGIDKILEGSTKVITNWSTKKETQPGELTEAEKLAKICGFVPQGAKVAKKREFTTDITAEPFAFEEEQETVNESTGRPLTDAEKIRKICGF